MVPLRTRGLSRAVSCISDRHVYNDLDPVAAKCRPRRRVFRQVFTFGAVFFGGLFAVSTLLRRRQQPYATGPEALAAKSVPPQAAVTAAANISLWNSYSFGESFRLDPLYPWTYLAEPHKTSVLMIDTLEDGFDASVR